MLPRIWIAIAFVSLAAVVTADPPAKKSPREALLPFGTLVGVWKGTGQPVGTREEIQRNFWTETMTWGWKFKDKDAWLTVAFDKSKHFSAGELHYVADKDHFALTLTNLKKEKITYVGNLKEKIMSLERAGGKEAERLVFTFLHSNRFLYRYEVKPDGRALFAKKWTVGATKDGEPFAAGSGKPECVVSGGQGSIAVSYMGKTYHVCCSGCRDEFNADPAKYIKEYEAKKAKKK